MDGKNEMCQNVKLESLFILFIGDADRANRIQDAVAPCGWEISMETQAPEAMDEEVHSKPDLVILDDFPDSMIARSAFYELYHFRAVRFLVLNDSPDAMRFFHVNALSFMKIIHRDPEPEELIRAISELIGTFGKRPSLIRVKNDLRGKSSPCRSNDFCCLQGGTS